MSAKAGKRPLRSLTAHEKLDAIRRVHDGESKASVARDIGVPESTLRGWCKNEDKISYLSRQSSPETDDSVDHPPGKRAKLDDALQPFNLSLKTDPEVRGYDYLKATGGVDADVAGGAKSPLNLNLNVNANVNVKQETPKTSERERTRAELARLSVELGLNRPEMFLPAINNASSNLADLTANIGLLAQWNSLLMQQQQQQQQQSKTAAPKASSKADSSGAHNLVTSSNGVGLLTTVDAADRNKLPKDKHSVHDSVWYWLKQQQTMLGLSQSAQLPTQGSSVATPSTAGVAAAPSSTPLGGMTAPDQSSWFWKWYKQFAYTQQAQQQQQHQQQTSQTDVQKPILYRQLVKEASTPDQQQLDQQQQQQQQQNAENLSLGDGDDKEKAKANGIANGNSKARSVLDNLLFNNNNNNNNNNVSSNKKDAKDGDGTDGLSQPEAVEHGEKFLRWLEACSDPSVTAMQIMQFRTLLNNVKTGADRRNGDLQNKTKVKRK